MPDGPHEDVTSTLSQLERRLIELERELLAVAGAPSAEAPVALPATPAPPAPARPEKAELAEFRDHLRTIADDLVERVDRLLAKFDSPDSADRD